VSSLKSQWAEIPVARRIEKVEDEPLMLKAHHRRGDRDAARSRDDHPVGARLRAAHRTRRLNWDFRFLTTVNFDEFLTPRKHPFRVPCNGSGNKRLGTRAEKLSLCQTPHIPP
jgi:hypothetical protein